MRATTAAALAVVMLLAAAAAPRAAAFLLPTKPGGGGGGGSGAVCAEGTGQPAKLAVAAHLLGAVGKGGKLPVVCVKCAPGSFSWGNNTGPCLPCSACPSGVCADGLCSSVVTFDSVKAVQPLVRISDLPSFEGFFWGGLFSQASILEPGVTPVFNCTGSELGAGYAQAVVSKPNVGISLDFTFNPTGIPVVFSPAAGGKFTLRSFYASAAYRNGMTLTVEALDAPLGGPNATVLATFSTTVTTTSRTFVDLRGNAGFANVAAVRLLSSGGTPSGLCGGRNTFNIGFDNVVTSYVPVVPAAAKGSPAAAAAAALVRAAAGAGPKKGAASA